MAWADRQHLPALAQDWRYQRLINLTKRRLRADLNTRLARDLRRHLAAATARRDAGSRPRGRP